MFNVFGELFETQSMKLVKHNSIGIGLNCSQLLAKSLNGQVILLNSKAGVFAIQLSLPVGKVKLGKVKINTSHKACLSPSKVLEDIIRKNQSHKVESFELLKEDSNS